MARPRLRTPEMRDEILSTAIALLGRRGPAAITTRGVAAAAKTSPAAIAELFGGKPGLVSAVFSAGFEQLSRELGDAPGSDDPIESLTTIGAAYRAFAAHQPDLFDVMFSRPFIEFAPQPSDLAVAKDIHDTFTRPFATLLGQTKNSNAVVDSATGYVALLHGLAMQERAGILGSTPASRNRRWMKSTHTFLRGVTAAMNSNPKDLD